jgi:hypothetical protein
MENSLDLYNRILFLDLRPWNEENKSDLKFKQLLFDLPKEYYTNQPIYEVDFVKPLSNIRKYYAQLIENEAIRFLNDILSEVSASMNMNEKTYHVHFALSRTLSQKLKETNNVITTRNYSPEQFNPSVKIKADAIAVSNESYVLHLLKHQLVRLVLEFQESFPDNLKEDALSEEEMYFKYFNEPAPLKSYIVKAENYPNTKPSITSFIKPEKAPFNAIQNDIRNEKKGILTYGQIIKNPSRFAKIEEDLFSYGYIDENYNFTDKHGQKQYLAAFYHQLIAKKYFNDRIFPGNAANSPLQIRKFLDHRYNADVDKQFRNWTNDKQALAVFIEKDYWLDHILAC